MAQEQLHRPSRSSGRVEESGIHMPEPVLSHTGHSQILSGRTQLPVEQIASTHRRTPCGGEDQGFWIRSEAKLQKDFESFGAKRHPSIAPLGLGGVEVSFINRLAHPQPLADKVNISPSQCTDPQTSKHGEPCYRF
jgi:hypothetical protein